MLSRRWQVFRTKSRKGCSYSVSSNVTHRMDAWNKYHETGFRAWVLEFFHLHTRARHPGCTLHAHPPWKIQMSQLSSALLCLNDFKTSRLQDASHSTSELETCTIKTTINSAAIVTVGVDWFNENNLEISLQKMKSNKASGPNYLLSLIHLLFLLIWESKQFPQDLQDANILRKVIIQSVVIIVASSYSPSKGRSLPESSSNAFTISVNQFSLSLNMVFDWTMELQTWFSVPDNCFDLYNAFDSVPRAVPCGVLEKFGCPSEGLRHPQLLHLTIIPNWHQC